MHIHIFLIVIISIAIIIFLHQKKALSLRLFLTSILTIIILFILLNPKKCIVMTLKGINLFFYSVFPSLFVFLILCNLLIAFNGVEIYSKTLGKLLCKPLRLPESCAFPIIVSILCGYPLGAKYTYSLFDEGKIDKACADRLLNIASNPSPVFVIGTLGTTMLKDTNLGYLLLLSNYIASFVMSLLMKPSRFKYKENYKSKTELFNIGMALRTSIENAINTTLMVGGFIVFFFLLTSIVNDNILIFIKNNTIKATFTGIIEMTQGCSLITSTTDNLKTKIILCSFFINFSGLSVVAQVYAFIYKYNVSIIRYMFLKLSQGFIASIVMFFLSNFYLRNTTVSANFNEQVHYLYIFLFIFLIIPILLEFIKKLFLRNNFF
ncbi:sporulation integral membrane protein YlbJ [Clostridium cellulovorans]|uniref:Sporulation integral membrane protein YlbJ n=1 Tax=Clostridium cellulovorans (strain ATCC 35296 / DSM 3052 / OCM 3 / 743B) TaxID=573061 RepID=D9SLB7_CLOC7|nr:sporulation integral membrane protein YlbJ [Clostridium cellulovorans]ADL51633.1 sporulation integral membrane protein YlbJ [Clostridium cellulovorans 743B]